MNSNSYHLGTCIVTSVISLQTVLQHCIICLLRPIKVKISGSECTMLAERIFYCNYSSINVHFTASATAYNCNVKTPFFTNTTAYITINITPIIMSTTSTTNGIWSSHKFMIVAQLLWRRCYEQVLIKALLITEL